LHFHHRIMISGRWISENVFKIIRATHTLRTTIISISPLIHIIFKMEDLFQGLYAIIGVVIGFLLSWGRDCLRERGSTKKYAKLVYFELQNLKVDIDKRLEAYDQLCRVTRDELGLSREHLALAAEHDPHKFLLRLDFRPKYTFIHENLEKISLLSTDTIKLVLQIYSLLREFEEYRQVSIRNFVTGELEKTAMNSAEWLLEKDLRDAQKLIPNALLLLKEDCSTPIIASLKSSICKMW